MKNLKLGDKVKITKSTALFGTDVIGKTGVIFRFDKDGDPVLKLDHRSCNYGEKYIVDTGNGDECELVV